MSETISDDWMDRQVKFVQESLSPVDKSDWLWMPWLSFLHVQHWELLDGLPWKQVEILLVHSEWTPNNKAPAGGRSVGNTTVYRSANSMISKR